MYIEVRDGVLMKVRTEEPLSLEQLQALVGGRIGSASLLHLTDGFKANGHLQGYWNDSGGPENLAVNVWIEGHVAPIAGPLVITGIDTAGFERLLSEEEMDSIWTSPALTDTGFRLPSG